MDRERLTPPDARNQAGVPLPESLEEADYELIDVGFRRIAGVAPDRAQAISAAPFGFRPVDSLERDFHEQGHRGEGSDGNQSNGRGLPERPANLVCDQHSDSKAKGSARENHQTVERNLLGGFWNGYRKRHRLPLYVSFWKRKRENLAARALERRLLF